MTDMFITINPEDYERVKKDFNQKMLVRMIPGIGVNFDRLNIENRKEVRMEYREKLGIPADGEVLIYVAEILKNKNQQMLIHTLKELHDKGQGKCICCSQVRTTQMVSSISWLRN